MDLYAKSQVSSKASQKIQNQQQQPSKKQLQTKVQSCNNITIPKNSDRLNKITEQLQRECTTYLEDDYSTTGTKPEPPPMEEVNAEEHGNNNNHDRMTGIRTRMDDRNTRIDRRRTSG